MTVTSPWLLVTYAPARCSGTPGALPRERTPTSQNPANSSQLAMSNQAGIVSRNRPHNALGPRARVPVSRIVKRLAAMTVTTKPGSASSNADARTMGVGSGSPPGSVDAANRPAHQTIPASAIRRVHFTAGSYIRWASSRTPQTWATEGPLRSLMSNAGVLVEEIASHGRPHRTRVTEAVSRHEPRPILLRRAETMDPQAATSSVSSCGGAAGCGFVRCRPAPRMLLRQGSVCSLLYFRAVSDPLARQA